jgi:hypothetical protein
VLAASPSAIISAVVLNPKLLPVFKYSLVLVAKGSTT